MPNTIRHLVNASGNPFDQAELRTLREALNSLVDMERTSYRDENAKSIYTHTSRKVLIVSGPGTGKSYIFKKRIIHWLDLDDSAEILAVSFVRKLVADLENDIKGEDDLSDQHKGQVDVSTLHKYARSIVEQNHGVSRLRFEPFLKIMVEVWLPIVWKDVLLLAEETDEVTFSIKEFNKQLHDFSLNTSQGWRHIQRTYFKLSKFYNAVGFADLINYAEKALEENPQLVRHQYFIVDEFQDFNTAEEKFIKRLTETSTGILTVGDDDQVLYEELKSGKASLIRDLYQNEEFANAMLPFCGRSSFHIVNTAQSFIKQSADPDCIEKIYLPLSTTAHNEKVQIIGCATPTTAVDYIKKFIDEHAAEIEERKIKLEEGQSKDPFLLILSPTKKFTFFRSSNADKTLMGIVENYKGKNAKFSEDYYKVLTYFSLSNHPTNNFTFRKVLYFENTDFDVVNELIKECLISDKKFYELTNQDLINETLNKCQKVKDILNSSRSLMEKTDLLSNEIVIENKDELKRDLERNSIDENQIVLVEHQEDEDAEQAELDIKPMSAVELLTIVGSKGLSADHVMIIGFDDVNMVRIKKNAFYVAMTRARKSLHLITSLGAGGSQRPHDFLGDLPESHLQFFQYKKTDGTKKSFDTRDAFINNLAGQQAYKRNV